MGIDSYARKLAKAAINILHDAVLTGTTRAENIICTGDFVGNDVDVQGSITVPTPQSNYEAATKQYVDTHSGGTNWTTIGIMYSQDPLDPENPERFWDDYTTNYDWGSDIANYNSYKMVLTLDPNTMSSFNSSGTCDVQITLTNTTNNKYIYLFSNETLDGSNGNIDGEFVQNFKCYKNELGYMFSEWEPKPVGNIAYPNTDMYCGTSGFATTLGQIDKIGITIDGTMLNGINQAGMYFTIYGANL